ncbi:ubiB [Symbiodinium sp. KB8]|nr:ubiB [Symbiodinium sp. KB8]
MSLRMQRRLRLQAGRWAQSVIVCGIATAGLTKLCFTSLSTTTSRDSCRSKGLLQHVAVAASATTAADLQRQFDGLLQGERYIAMNRYRIREGGEAQFEQRWGSADSTIAGLDGFRWFCLLRRVPSTPKSTGALSVVYNYDDEQFEDDYTYVSLSVWDTKTQFDAALSAERPNEPDVTEGKASFTKMAVNGVATMTGPPKPANWDGMLLESKAADAADSKVFIVMNRFAVKDGCEPEFEKRWAQRESKLQEAEGFKFFQLLRRDQVPDDDVNYISMSAWTDRDAFDKWWGSKSFANMAQVQGSLLESEIVRYFYEGLVPAQDFVKTSSNGLCEPWRVNTSAHGVVTSRYRDTLLANREAGEVHRLEEAARSVSEEELAQILGNSFPGSVLRPAENCEDPEDLERLQEEFLEIVQSSDSQAALRAVESATSEIVNASDECVGSALHFIAAEGHVQACRALLARSDFGQANSRNGIGSTALHIAAANDEEEICKMILACPRFTVGAAAVNNNGQTSMDFAAEFGTGLCLDILEASGCRYGTCRRRGRQVLNRRPANALGAQAEEVADMNELCGGETWQKAAITYKWSVHDFGGLTFVDSSASHLLPDFVSPQSSYSGMLCSGLFAQRARCGQDYQATQLGVVMSCALVRRWRYRRKTRRGLGRHVARLPVAGKYDGPALDEYFGSDPFRALGRLVEVLSRINAARTAWQDSNLPVAVRGQHLRSQVASLGTVFVKLAQTMATRSDLVTKELGKELGLLQDAMGQFSNNVAMQTIREETRADVGSMMQSQTGVDEDTGKEALVTGGIVSIETHRTCLGGSLHSSVELRDAYKLSDSITHLGEEEGDILDYRFENGDSVGEKEDAERPDDPVPQEDEELGPRVADERTPGIVAGGKKIVHLADIDEDEMTMEKMMSLLFLLRQDGLSTAWSKDFRYLQDPGYEPDLFRRAMERRALSSGPGELEKQQRFKQARMRLEQADRPWHVLQSSQHGDAEMQGFVDDLRADLYMCKIEVPLPEKTTEWKKMNRDATTWMLKWDAKDRGFEDPDLETIVSSSPTMSRRTRQLFYLLTKVKGWQSLKGDVKAAFLQGNESQLARGIYAQAPPELARRLGVPPWAAVQLQKAAYGLVNAPAEWYRTVHHELSKLGFERLRTEPCGWRLTTTTAEGRQVLLGIIIAHVDDFLVCGDVNNELWMEALSKFYSRFRWSPWETNEYMHCGVRVKEARDEVILEQGDYCASIDQVQFEKRDENLPASPEEVTQLRGVSGAIRAYSTAPQYMATLSMLQSQTSKATVATLQAANKLAREVYAQRHMCIKIPDLQVEQDEITSVAWCDAAVGNRPDPLGDISWQQQLPAWPMVTCAGWCQYPGDRENFLA